MKLIGGIVGAMIILAGFALWWTGRPPQRPNGVSANALYMERGVVPFKLSSTPGDWLDCWLDEQEHVDRCKLTDEKGKLEFQDVFVPYKGQMALQSNLIFDSRRTGRLWTGSYEKGFRNPVVYLSNGEILLPRSDYEKAKQTVDWLNGGRESP
jgi:hypothetical protein